MALLPDSSTLAVLDYAGIAVFAATGALAAARRRGLCVGGAPPGLDPAPAAEAQGRGTGM